MAHATKTAPRTERQGNPMEEMLTTFGPAYPKVGDLIEGTIIAVERKQIFVDVNGVLTGIVRGRELWDESGEFSRIKIGDAVSATIVDEENEQGLLELSFRLAGHQKAWDRLKKLKEEEMVIPVKVKDANRGGLMVVVGNTPGFLPVSQLAPEHYPRVEGGDKQKILDILKGFMGTTLNVKVIDINSHEQKLIVSERAAEAGRQKQSLSKYKVGDTINGKVVGVVDFGAFVEFDEGLEGLVHISEIAWQRIDDPRSHIKIGEPITAKIIGIDESKVSLSLKALTPDPWQQARERYPVGALVLGSVEKVNPFGLFVELDKDIHGLVHVSELSEKPIEGVAGFMEVGKQYPFRVISLEPHLHRLGLSHKRVPEEVRANPELLPEFQKKERDEKEAAVVAPEPAEPAASEPAVATV